MFGRTVSPDAKAGDNRPGPSAPQRPPASGSSSGPLTSVIGPDLSIIGQAITLVCKSTLIITGEVVGNINGSEVTVGDTGKVTGTITAHNIAVHGEVKGALRAATVTLHSSAHIDGDIVQKHLVIAEGAKFDGRVRAAVDPSEFEPIFDVAVIAATTGT